MALKFYTTVAKVSKLRARKLSELIPTSIEGTGEKLIKVGGRGALYPLSILDRVYDLIRTQLNKTTFN